MSVRTFEQDGLSNPSSGPSMTEIASALLGSATPRSEAVAPTAGAAQVASRDDHRHPRLTSTTQATIATGNTASVMFTRSFVNEPGIDYQELPPTADTTTPTAADTNANAQPTNSKVVAWMKGPTTLLPDAAATDYTGCVVRVWRSQTIPTNLVTLLLGGVFNLFAASVVGTRFSIIAVARSDVAG